MCWMLIAVMTLMPVDDQILDILEALLVPGAGDIGVRELIDDRDLGLARDDRVDIHLVLGGTAILDGAARNDLEVANFVHGLGAVVRFDETDDHVDPLGAQLMRLFQHLVCFPYPSGGANVDLQPPFERLRDQIKKRFGFGAMVILHAMCSTPRSILLFGARLRFWRRQFIQRQVEPRAR